MADLGGPGAGGLAPIVLGAAGARPSPLAGQGPLPPLSPKGVPLPDAVREQVLLAVAGLQEDTRDEAALGDEAAENRNIAVGDAAWTLRDLVAKHRDCARFALENGGLEALVLALHRRPNSEAVQAKATGVLGHLVVNSPQSLSLAGQAGAVEAVISALRGHPNSQSVQENATEALGHLLTQGHPENQSIARKAGGVEAVVLALDHHPENQGLQKTAATALAGLVLESPECQGRALRAEALRVLCGTMQRHLGVDAVQEAASSALANLLGKNKEGQRPACHVGAVASVLTVLKRHRTSKRVQSKALMALTHLVSGYADGQRLAGEAGAAEVVSGSLKAFGSHEGVQIAACHALAALVADNADNQNAAREVGLVAMVIECILKHKGSSSLQLVGLALETLGILVAGNAASQRRAGESGGIEAVAAGLRRHAADQCVTVKEQAALALEQLCRGCRENQVLIRKSNIVESLLFVLRQHPDDASLQGRGLAALRSVVVECPGNTKAAVAAGGVEEVAAALQVGVAKPGQDEYQILARDAGLIEAITYSLLQPPKPSLLLASAKPKRSGPGPAVASTATTMQAILLVSLADVVRGQHENQQQAAESGAVEAVVATMKSNPNVEEIQERGSQALECLLWESASCQRIAKASAASEVLLGARIGHPESTGIKEAVERALEALNAGALFAERVMSTAYGRRHSTATMIQDPAMRGVTLEQLLELQDFVQDSLQKNDIVDAGSGRSICWEDLNMYQVRDSFVFSLTKQCQCSFVELIAPGKQPPMWMISHWWGTPFNFTIRMLQLQARSRHLHAAVSVTYWCDAFANNQRSLSMHEFEEVDVLNFPFARAMLSPSCMGTVLLCDPEVTALLRTWCVFEAHVTQQLRCGALADRCDKKRYFLDILAPVVERDSSTSTWKRQDKVTITMLQDAIGGSWNEVSDTEGVFFPLGVAHAGVGVNIGHAEASEECDQRTILNFLTQGIASRDPPPKTHPKYDELNKFVHNVFASAELYRVASEQPNECVEAASALLEMRADVNSFVRMGQTPLFAAAGADPAGQLQQHDHVAQRGLLDLLLAARADVNHASADMKTVLDCAASLSDDSRGLLIEHGAKTFKDAAPDLERAANAQLAQIVSTGFASEQQAFIGGDAGTKLSSVAQRVMQASASILKLYHWAPCRIGMQTSLSRHQASLAPERAGCVRIALESAGCKNVLNVACGAQVCLLTMLLSLVPSGVPPITLTSPAVQAGSAKTPGQLRKETVVGAGVAAVGVRPRSPQAVLALRGGAPSRLPPVAIGRASGPQALGSNSPSHADHSASGGSSPGNRRGPGSLLFGFNALDDAARRPSVTSSPIGFAGIGGSHFGWDSPDSLGQRDGRPSSGAGLRRQPSNEGTGALLGATGVRGQAQAWASAVGKSPWDKAQPPLAVSRHASGPGAGAVGAPDRPGAPAATGRTKAPGGAGISAGQAPPAPGSPGPPGSGLSPPRVATDLDSLAGDRWFQTSITCSRSSPSLHTFKGEGVVSEVKGLGSTSPFAGMDGESSHRKSGPFRVNSSSRAARPAGPGDPQQPVRPVARAAPRAGGESPRPAGASGSRPRNGVQRPAEVATQEAEIVATGVDCRPPTRGGHRPGPSAGGQARRVPEPGREVTGLGDCGPLGGGGGTYGLGDSDLPGVQMHSLPTLQVRTHHAPVQRSGSRVFSVSDLMG